MTATLPVPGCYLSPEPVAPGEIRRCQRLLDEAPELRQKVLVRPLYGDLPFAAQEEAILPAARRKVVLATNIAETSLTIEGVGVVIDAGFRVGTSTTAGSMNCLSMNSAMVAIRSSRTSCSALGLLKRASS